MAWNVIDLLDQHRGNGLVVCLLHGVSISDDCPLSRLRIGYFVDHGCKDDLLIVHPQWTTSSYTRAYITQILFHSQTGEDKFIPALDRCHQLAIDLLALISKGVQPVPKSVTQFPRTAMPIMVHHCKQG